jgi:hypothetical protein
MRRTSVLAAAALAVGLLAPARGEEEVEVGSGRFAMQATVQNDAEGGALFAVEGTAPGLPDGALLHITLAVKGKYTAPVEAAFFQVRVEEQRFAARKAFPKQRFAPELYWARAELFLSNQRKAVRDWIRRELGVGERAKLLLAKQDIEIGTVEDRAAFAQAALVELRRFVVAFKGARDAVGKAIARDPDEGWAAARDEHQAALEQLGGELRDYLQPYVVWSEQQLISTLDSARAEVAWSLRAYDEGRHKKARAALEGTETTFTRLLAEIESRLPKRAEREPADRGSGK